MRYFNEIRTRYKHRYLFLDCFYKISLSLIACIKLSKQAQPYIPLTSIFGMVFFIIGIAFLCVSWSYQEKECSASGVTKVEIDYTYCKDPYADENITCRDKMLKTNGYCSCFVSFNLTTALVGDIVLYYELETFNQSETAKEANFFQSRDDNQLRGELSANVSEACGNYSYDKNGNPIAPCGALADSMFTDVLDIIPPHKGRSFVPQTTTGLIPDEQKIRFRNPEPKDNLTSAFQNFSHPISWDDNIWELDPAYPENNGFENVVFIGWMTTEWKRKPMWRLNRTKYEEFKDGLPVGTYTLQVEYKYPITRYDGPRKAVLAKPFWYSDEPNCTTHVRGSFGTTIGITAVIIAVFFLAITAVAILPILNEKRKANVTTADPSMESLRAES